MNQRKKARVVVVKLLDRCISASLVVVLGTGETVLIDELIALVVDFNYPIDAITPEDSAAIRINTRNHLSKVRGACV